MSRYSFYTLTSYQVPSTLSLALNTQYSKPFHPLKIQELLCIAVYFDLLTFRHLPFGACYVGDVY